MKIRKTDIPGLDTKPKVEAALNIHTKELEYRANVGNKPFTQNIKIRELHNHISSNLPWEFIDKTLQEEKDDAKLEAEKLAEQSKRNRIILAKTDGEVRDLLVTELMNEAGYVQTNVLFKKMRADKGEIDQTEFDQFMSDRDDKLAEIKTMIQGS